MSVSRNEPLNPPPSPFPSKAAGGLLDLLAAPWNAAGLLTAAKSFEANPILGSPQLNARGLHAARVSLACRMAARRRAKLAHLVPPEDRAAFQRDGFVVRRDFL
ncbi:MAG: hypothetical protein JO303_07880, partial [Caulobacteraceae bacterium]|nr:hypothetical protein [Caulobacteraceae bacterium]